LLDLNLPLICGVEVCRRIKSQHPAQPVIICSAAILDTDIATLRAMRVEQYLSKPYHPLELLRRIADELSGADGPDRSNAPVPCARTRLVVAPRSEPPRAHTLVKIPVLD